MNKIKNAHDRFFVKVFSDKENIKSFLKISLPTGVLNVLDFSTIDFDLKSYITGEIKAFSSDMVVKLKMLAGDKKKVDTDIYFLFEHKSYQDKKIFMQLLKYMYLMWQKDMDDGQPLRVIIPIVFYHDKYEWKMPRSFNDQFDVNEDVKKFLLNYKYVLFDTNSWDLEDKRNEKLRDNVNLMAYLFLMKNAFNKSMDALKRLIKFWIKRGMEEDTDLIISSLNYIVSIQDIAPEKIIEILEESEIQGGEIMQSLAQRWLEQGIEEGKIETVKELMKNGIDIDIIAKSTGFSKKEIKKLAAKTH